MLNVAIKQAGQAFEIGQITRSRRRKHVRATPVTAELTTARFRHSDTVLLTDDGIEILTYYPRDLASLIIPV